MNWVEYSLTESLPGMATRLSGYLIKYVQTILKVEDLSKEIVVVAVIAKPRIHCR